MVRVQPAVVAACIAAAAACSPATSGEGGAPTQRDAGAADTASSGVDAGASDATPAPRCDAGEPADTYATAQPFECNESLQTIATRPAVTLSFDLVVPTGRGPTAIVILLPGGAGLLHLSAQGIGSAADNFAVRTRQRYAMAGFAVAVPDAPSDHDAGLDNFRATPGHAEDLAALIVHLRVAYPGLHVWLVSTSRGTISATNALARLSPPKGPDHIVLTSSVTTIPTNATDQEDIQSVPGYQTTLTAAVPVLMIDEAQDQCGASPPLSGAGGAGAEALAQVIGDAKHFVLVDGGAAPPAGADKCGGIAYHGFYGEDEPVVSTIVAFMQAHP
jgi:hypothetical protein